MRIITADESGLLKLINAKSKEYATFGTSSREHAIKGICWHRGNDAIGVLRSNGDFEAWKVADDMLSLEHTYSNFVKSPAGIVSLQNDRILLYNVDGQVKIGSFTSSTDAAASIMLARSPLHACAVHGAAAAFGGRENDVQVWDTETSNIKWSAKNVPHDNLSLRVPVFVSSIAFQGNEHQIVTGTMYKHVRTYDTRQKSRPMTSWNIGDFAVTRVLPSHDGEYIYISDVSGGVQTWDVRKGRRVATLSPAAGSVRELTRTDNAASPIATVSLDRYLRLYHPSSNKIIFSAYLKNRLQSCLLFDDCVVANATESEEEDDDDVLERYSESSENSDDIPLDPKAVLTERVVPGASDMSHNHSNHSHDEVHDEEEEEHEHDHDGCCDHDHSHKHHHHKRRGLFKSNLTKGFKSMRIDVEKLRK